MTESRKRKLWATMLLIAATQNAVAGDIKGKIMDSELNEPLMGAAIRVVGTNKGTTADLDGNFVLKGLKKGEYTLQISYISFHTQTITVSVPNKGEVSVTVDMKPDNKELNEVTVTARKNLELERVLLAERKQASIIIFASPGLICSSGQISDGLALVLNARVVPSCPLSVLMYT